MDTDKKVMSVKLFKTMRWLSVLSFIAVTLAIVIPINKNILLAGIIIYVVSFVYIVFWRCTSCGKRYGTKPGFIGICWPYVGHCLHCNKSLGS